MDIPEIYSKFRHRIQGDVISFGDVFFELFNESDLEFEQENSPLPAGVKLRDHEPYDPGKHLIIAAGPFNEPWFIDTADPDPQVKAALPARKDHVELTVTCISDSLEDLASTIEYLQEAEREMKHRPDKEMLDVIFSRIKEINENADTGYWDVWLAEGEKWIERGN